MYRPPAFAEDRPEVLAALIRANPLGLLISTGADGRGNPGISTAAEGYWPYG